MRPSYIAALGLVLLYCMSLLIGVLFAATGFIQSDTCWLVGLGQIILNNGTVPNSDPFSFTLPLLAQNGSGQPFVVYQWLSDVIFAFICRAFQLEGLAVMSALVVVFASICLLLRICLNASGKLFFTFSVVFLAAATVGLRLMVRPEIFTLLFIVIWSYLLRRGMASVGASSSSPVPQVGLDWRAVAALTLTMIVWCNMHSGFVIGVLTLFVYAVSSFCQEKLTKQKLSWRTKTLFVSR